VTQLYDLVLAPSGLKTSQFVLLRAIAEAGEIAQWQISKNLFVAEETLTRRLAAMRRSGWIGLRMGPDRREHLYRLTEAGRKQLEQAEPYWQRAQRRLREQLGEPNWKETMECLGRLAISASTSVSVRRKNLAA
jgi:DNA-binding MarR family transcriptional regulator